jgi:hypothetical protein
MGDIDPDIWDNSFPANHSTSSKATEKGKRNRTEIADSYLEAVKRSPNTNLDGKRSLVSFQKAVEDLQEIDIAEYLSFEPEGEQFTTERMTKKVLQKYDYNVDGVEIVYENDLELYPGDETVLIIDESYEPEELNNKITEDWKNKL